MKVKKKKHAIVGMGHRGRMFLDQMAAAQNLIPPSWGSSGELVRDQSDSRQSLTCPDIAVTRGGLYRLRFRVKAGVTARDFLTVGFQCRGDEGPAWEERRLSVRAADTEQTVDILFRAQVDMNPIHTLDLQFKLHPNHAVQAADRGSATFHDITLSPYRGEPVIRDVSRWLRVPGFPALRYADFDLGCGSGVALADTDVAVESSVPWTRVETIEDIREPRRYAVCGRTRRLYASADEAAELSAVRVRARVDTSGRGLLNMPDTRFAPARRQGTIRRRRRALRVSLADASPHADCWPVTQGVPFPRGAVAHDTQIRMLDAGGREIDAQVRATLYWEDGTIGWALLDFNVDTQAAEYMIEYGTEIERRAVEHPLTVTASETGFEVDAGALRFTMPADGGAPVSGIRPADREGPPLEGPRLTISDAENRVYRAGETAPFLTTIEECGPMRATIATHGWYASGDRRFLSWTTRVTAYRNQSFVRVLHTVTHRGADDSVGRYPNGAPDGPIREFRQQNVARASLDWTLPQSPQGVWHLGSVTQPIETARLRHCQEHRERGILCKDDDPPTPFACDGTVHYQADGVSVTAAIHHYENLFPNEIRIDGYNLSLGWLPFSAGRPHGILAGTARSVEMLLAVHSGGHDAGARAAALFRSPPLLAAPALYCEADDVMNERYSPADPQKNPYYERMVANIVETMKAARAEREHDDCGQFHYGDFNYEGYNNWLDLEYDTDLALYVHFIRSGDRYAFLRGVDATRHFLDVDMMWHHPDPHLHGNNLHHGAMHYALGYPSGHTYTAGLPYYYLLTGDWRGLQGARSIADCAHRYLLADLRSRCSREKADGPLACFQTRLVNTRHYSTPARYALLAYQCTGEPRFLETAFEVAMQLAAMPPDWLGGNDDAFINYRYPMILHALYRLTGVQELRELLVRAADSVYRYSLERDVECRAVSRNDLFAAYFAWEWTGDRRYLDWTNNLLDGHHALTRRDPAAAPFQKTGGAMLVKSAGADMTLHARALALTEKERWMHLDWEPARITLRQAGRRDWTLFLRNTAGAPWSGRVSIGPLPDGIRNVEEQKFTLPAGETTELTFALDIDQTLRAGRSLIPFRVQARSDAAEQSRTGYFAVLMLKSDKNAEPRLLLHAPLEGPDRVVAQAAGDPAAAVETATWIQGRVGGALGADTAPGGERYARKGVGPQGAHVGFAARDNLNPVAGTLTCWLNCRDPEVSARTLVKGLPTRYTVLGFCDRAGFGALFSLVAVKADNPAQIRIGFGEHSAIPIDTHRWVHIAVTWDLEHYTLYTDGQPRIPEKRTRFDPLIDRIVLSPHSTAAFDELRIYSAPLTPEKIAQLA